MDAIIDTAIINRPAEEVWEFISDPNNNPKWYAGTLEVRRISAGPIAVGETVQAVVQFRGRSLMLETRCAALSRNRELKWEFTSGITQGSKDSWRMEAADESGTRLTRVFDLRVRGWWRLLRPIVARGARKAHRSEMTNIKRILEEGS